MKINKLMVLGAMFIAGLCQASSDNVRWVSAGTNLQKFQCLGYDAARVGNTPRSSLILDCSNDYIGVSDPAPASCFSAGASGSAMTVDCTNRKVSIGSDITPDAVLEVSPRSLDTFGLIVSSANGSTSLLSVNVTNGLTASVGSVSVSSTTNSRLSLCFKGAFETLPTTGVEEGCLAYQISDHKLYTATITVTAADSWKGAW